MAKLEIDYIPETDETWEFLRFRQEEHLGFTLPMCYLAEFVAALDRQPDGEVFYFWHDYGVQNTRRSCTITVSTKDKPLLHITADQRSKLILYLKETFPSAI